MSERPPFDPIRATFFLVAAIIGVHCVVVLAGAGICAWRIVHEAGQTFECDPKGRLGELLSAALAAALAFAGGMSRGGGPPSAPPPRP